MLFLQNQMSNTSALHVQSCPPYGQSRHFEFILFTGLLYSSLFSHIATRSSVVNIDAFFRMCCDSFPCHLKMNSLLQFIGSDFTARHLCTPVHLCTELAKVCVSSRNVYGVNRHEDRLFDESFHCQMEICSTLCTEQLCFISSILFHSIARPAMNSVNFDAHSEALFACSEGAQFIDFPTLGEGMIGNFRLCSKLGLSH